MLLFLFYRLLRFFLQLDGKELLLVIPLVNRGADVETFLALEADEPRLQC